MRRFAWVLILTAALLAACGGNTPAADAPTPAEQPTEIFQARVATEAPSAVPATAAPTAQLILPPTAVPTPAPQAAQPTAKPAAKPAAQPAAPPPPAPARAVGPTRIVIDDIGIDYRPVSVGLDKQRVPIVPDHDVGWYNLSSGPGEGENIVLWGHVLRFRNAPNIPAPFAHLKDLKPGASIVLYDGDGNPHSYVVKQQVWVKPDEVEYILPKGKEMVTMVSCIGDKVISNGEVVDESHRLITIAEPA